jgi:hypothetical protein
VADPVSLKRFLTDLGSLLAPLDEQGLRSALYAYASTLPAGARTGFLEDLVTACVPRQPAAPDDAALITAIEGFITDVKSGMYYEGWGWDPDLRHERAFGDGSWVPRMDDLFNRASNAFLAERHALSAEAHLRLFTALALEGDEGSLYSYEFSPAESLMTDLTEAGARCLRSLYETATGLPEAAAALAETWLNALPFGHQPTSLTALREALPADLADIEDFYPHWTRELVERSGGRDPLRSALLREAALLAGGTDALAEAARREGPGQPETYLDLVDALSGHGESQAALEACREGLRLAARPGADRTGWAAYQWAPLADRAAELAGAETAVSLRIQAFTLAVSTARLVALYQAAETCQPSAGPQAAGEAADRLAKGEAGLAHYHLESFRAQALLLAGRIDDALDLLVTGDTSTHGSPGAILTVLPYVLAASCGAASHRDWPNTVLHTLLDRTANAGRTIFSDDEFDTNDTAALSDLLEQLLREGTSSTADRAKWRRAGRAAIDRWVRGIVGGKQRAQYADAARLAAALTEAEILTEGDSNYLDGVLDTYRRHTAFRREAETVRRGSVLL